MTLITLFYYLLFGCLVYLTLEEIDNIKATVCRATIDLRYNPERESNYKSVINVMNVLLILLWPLFILFILPISGYHFRNWY